MIGVRMVGVSVHVGTRNWFYSSLFIIYVHMVKNGLVSCVLSFPQFSRSPEKKKKKMPAIISFSTTMSLLKRLCVVQFFVGFGFSLLSFLPRFWALSRSGWNKWKAMQMVVAFLIVYFWYLFEILHCWQLLLAGKSILLKHFSP